MIDFRELFNIKYGYLGIILIIILLLLIIILNKNTKKSLSNISTILIISGIINLIISICLKLFINILIDSTYRAFIEVISNSLYNTLLYISIPLISLGIILIIINKYLISDKDN